MESFLKFKNYKCKQCRALDMAEKKSSNFSCPVVSSTTELLWENLTPSSRICCTISESLPCDKAANDIRSDKRSERILDGSIIIR